jgi:hypothetical protein
MYFSESGNRTKEEGDMIDMTRYLPALVASAALGVASCGDMGDASDTVTVTSKLQSFGTWVSPPVGLLLAPPGLARNVFAEPMTAWGLGSDNQVWVTRQNSNEVWDTGWNQLSNNVGQFATAPVAAVAINLSVGPLMNRYAIVAARNDDQKFYITIRDKFGGSIVQDWAALPGKFGNAPSITYVPPSSPIAPRNTLIVVGRDASTRQVIWMQNTLTNGFYNHAAWVTKGQIGRVSDKFPFAIVALAPPCNFTYPGAGLFAVTVNGQDPNSIFHSSKFNGTSWSPWTEMPFGRFTGDPAVATGCGNPGAEVVTFGRGTDQVIWFSTGLTGGSPGWTPIGSQTFNSQVTATGFVSNAGSNAVMVGAVSAATMFTNTALSH